MVYYVIQLKCDCGLCDEEVAAQVKVIKVSKKEFDEKLMNGLGQILDAINKDMKPKYQFVFDEMGNVIFLDYSEYGPEYANYNYRWVWIKPKDGPNKGNWMLIPFPEFHANSLELLPHEIELAKRAYEDIKKHEAGS